MIVLRCLLLFACLASAGIVALNGRWEASLSHANHTWIMTLARDPVWRPPPSPAYAHFKNTFGQAEHFAPENAPNVIISRTLNWPSMALDLLFYLWPVTLVSGLAYLALRGQRRDLLLHTAMTAGLGLTAGGATSVVIWAVLGGWGPPALEVFAGLGLWVGVIIGLASFDRYTPNG